MYFIDVQGTLIDDITKLPLPGAVSFINYLNATQTPYMVITNSTKEPSETFLAYLNTIGLAIDAAHYLDPLMVLRHHLGDHSRIAAYGSDRFLETIRQMGYTLEYELPDALLIGIKENFAPLEYAQIIELLLQGAALIGMHETSLYVKGNHRYPGIGAILKMLSYATSRPYSVVGKPSETFFNEALERLQSQESEATFDQITLISDDLKGDLIGARALGMRTVLVLSGKIRHVDEIIPLLAPHEHPDAIAHTIGDFWESLWRH